MFLSSATLASLRFFAAAARLLSFKLTALELHVTQGAVSHHVEHLEQTLGCKLFYRLPHQITLTEEGERFAAVVTRALEDIEEEAKAISAGRSIDIHLRAICTSLAGPSTRRFLCRAPDIKLFINAAYGHFDIARREFDLAIELTKGRLPALHCEVLMEEYLVPVCSPEYFAKHSFLKKPEDLARCTLLHDAQPWPSASKDAEWRHWLHESGAVDVDSAQGQFLASPLCPSKRH